MEYEIINGVLLSAHPKDLETAVVPKNVSTIAERAFISCRNTLKTVYLPSSLRFIDKRAFANCSKLENVYLPEGLIQISSEAFAYCPMLKELTIPKSVTSIKRRAFLNTPFYSNLKDEFSVVGDGILLKYNGSGGDVVIPYYVKSINESCFSKCDLLTSITLPSSIKQLEIKQFEMCLKLEKIILPEGLLRIKYQAFINCASLREITLPASVTDIHQNAFSVCSSLERINVREGSKNFKDIDGVLFDTVNNSLVRMPIMYRQANYTIPEWVRSIDEGAFENNENITQLIIPETVERINTNSFFMCSSLERITILSKDVVFGYCPFIDCEALTKVYMPNGCDNLDSNVFDECRNIRILNYKGYEFRANPINMFYYTAENLDELIVDKNYDTGSETDIVMIHTVAATDCVRDHSEKAEKFVRAHASGILHTLIDGESVNLFKEILSMAKLLKKENAEIVANYAIAHTQKGGSSEFQVKMSKYITDNFDGGSYFDTLKL